MVMRPFLDHMRENADYPELAKAYGDAMLEWQALEEGLYMVFFLLSG